MNLKVNARDLKLKHPFTCLVAGPTGSGKTVLVRNIIQDWKNCINGLDTKILTVLWCHGASQYVHSIPLPKVRFIYINGLPTSDDFEGVNLLVIDDLMTEMENNKQVLNLYTKGSHHNNISVFLITQNLYHKGSINRGINLNSHYTIVFRNPRDQSQILPLARQVSRKNPKLFIDAYEKATSVPHGYLMIDAKQDTPEEVKFRTRITTLENNGKLEPIAIINE
jgi:energy-coupling factor transporter ATP-binding protein EcfA2